MTTNNRVMQVVSNSSPLINLAIIGQLHLLERFFSNVWITDAVWRECVIDGSDKPGMKSIENASFLIRRQPKNIHLIQLLERELDKGESETLALAIETKADWVIIDEREARDIAVVYGLRTTGVIGILLRAKKESYITSVGEYLDILKNQAGFWLSKDFYQKILYLAGEK